MDSGKIQIFSLFIGIVLLLATSIFILIEKTSAARLVYSIASFTFSVSFLNVLLFQNFLVENFGYGVILIGFFMAISSLILGLLGIVLLNRFDKKKLTLISMIVAVTPLIIFLFI